MRKRNSLRQFDRVLQLVLKLGLIIQLLERILRGL